MYPSFIKSPLIQSIPLSESTSKNIYLKLEMLQPSGSFKDRGIGNLCEHLAHEGSQGFVSSSGGNAGMAVAYAGHRLNLPVTVIIPTTTSSLMVGKLKNSGADVIVHGNNWNEADELAQQKSQELNFGYIPPFDHPKIWQGYESIVDELKEQQVKPDAIVLSVGGGGLFTGILQGLEKHGWLKEVTLLTAETAGAASMATAIAEKKHIKLDEINTLAGTLGAKQVAPKAFEWSQKASVLPQVVTDKQAVSACLKFAHQHRLLVEPACGAALSVVYDNLQGLKPFNNIVVVVCGGNGISSALLEQWKHQFNL